MACFTVSLVAGIGVAVARHIVKGNEKKQELAHVEIDQSKFGAEVKWSKKLAYLELMLFGGSFVLALEHIIHGEITFYPPFLTAMESYETVMEMLNEIATVGTAMLGILVAAWAVGVLVVDLIKYRKRKANQNVELANEAK